MSEVTKYRFRFTATYTVESDSSSYPDDADPLDVERDNARELLMLGIEEGLADVAVELLETDYSVSRTSG